MEQHKRQRPRGQAQPPELMCTITCAAKSARQEDCQSAADGGSWAHQWPSEAEQNKITAGVSPQVHWQGSLRKDPQVSPRCISKAVRGRRLELSLLPSVSQDMLSLNFVFISTRFTHKQTGINKQYLPLPFPSSSPLPLTPN